MEINIEDTYLEELNETIKELNKELKEVKREYALLDKKRCNKIYEKVSYEEYEWQPTCMSCCDPINWDNEIGRYSMFSYPNECSPICLDCLKRNLETIQGEDE